MTWHSDQMWPRMAIFMKTKERCIMDIEELDEKQIERAAIFLYVADHRTCSEDSWINSSMACSGSTLLAFELFREWDIICKFQGTCSPQKKTDSVLPLLLNAELAYWLVLLAFRASPKLLNHTRQYWDIVGEKKTELFSTFCSAAIPNARSASALSNWNASFAQINDNSLARAYA